MKTSGRFRARKHSQRSRSTKANTARTRKWEQSLVGLPAALLKIRRNRRIALSRRLKTLKSSEEWKTWSTDEREEQSKALEKQIREKYEKEEATTKEEYEKMEMSTCESEDAGEIEEAPESSESSESESDPHSSEEDCSDSDFESSNNDDGDDSEPLEMDDMDVRAVLADLQAQTMARVVGNVRPFEIFGADDEDPVSD
jgi:hypothetical protein